MEIEESIDMPSLYHSVIQANLAAAIRANYRQQYRPLTQPTFLLEDWESEPDVAILPQRPLNWLLDEIKIKETPLAIMEIVSPRQGLQEIKEKLLKYIEKGVKSCWLINPLQETIQIYTPDYQHELFGTNTPKINDKTLNMTLDFEEIFS